jgi:hypothetical protein
MTGSVVVSRTDGRYWILAGVVLLVASGFLWIALASTQQSLRVAGFVSGGSFGLIGGVAWAVRWDELRAASRRRRRSSRSTFAGSCPRASAWPGKPRRGRRRRRSLGGLRDRRRRPDALPGSRRLGNVIPFPR